MIKRVINALLRMIGQSPMYWTEADIERAQREAVHIRKLFVEDQMTSWSIKDLLRIKQRAHEYEDIHYLYITGESHDYDDLKNRLEKIRWWKLRDSVDRHNALVQFIANGYLVVHCDGEENAHKKFNGIPDEKNLNLYACILSPTGETIRENT
jgi:hypothetical protein